MVVVDEKIAAVVAGDRWDRVVGNIARQVMRVMAQLQNAALLLLHLDHSDGDLRRPQLIDDDIEHFRHTAAPCEVGFRSPADLDPASMPARLRVITAIGVVAVITVVVTVIVGPVAVVSEAAHKTVVDSATQATDVAAAQTTMNAGKMTATEAAANVAATTAKMTATTEAAAHVAATPTEAAAVTAPTTATAASECGR